MKIKSLIVTSLIALTATAYSAQYTVSNVVTGDGSADALYQTWALGPQAGALLSGGIAAIGYFPAGYVLPTQAQFTAPGADAIRSTVISDFTITAFSLVGSLSESLGDALPGYVEGPTVQGAQITGTSTLIGRPLFVFAGNAATLGDSTEWAIKQIATIIDDVPFEGQYFANPLGGVAPAIGSFGSFTGNASGFGSSTYQTLQLVGVVPEPSAALLGALGALGLLRRRRN